MTWGEGGIRFNTYFFNICSFFRCSMAFFTALCLSSNRALNCSCRCRIAFSWTGYKDKNNKQTRNNYTMCSDRMVLSLSYHLLGRRFIVSFVFSSFLLQWSGPRIVCREGRVVTVTARCGWTENRREVKLGNGWLGGSR